MKPLTVVIARTMYEQDRERAPGLTPPFEEALPHVIDHWIGRAELVMEVFRAYFSDPNLVHINLLHGALAKPTHVQIMHLYPAFARVVALLQELIDIEGPQPGTAEWAQKVKIALRAMEVIDA